MHKFASKKYFKSFLKGKIEIRVKSGFRWNEITIKIFDREIQFSRAYLGLFQATAYKEMEAWYFSWWRFSFAYALRDGLEFVTICAYCDEEIGSVKAPCGEDDYNTLCYCANCEQVEGETKEISARQYDRLHA